MTKGLIFLSCLVTLFSGCASLLSPVDRHRSNIELSEIEHLHMGVTTSMELKNAFGGPDQVVPLSDTEDLWLYFDRVMKEPGCQRASFTIEKKSDLVSSAAWLPGSYDSIQGRDATLEHFNGKDSFEVRPVRPVGGHQYSNEVMYTSPQKSMSLWVNETTHRVSVIGFGTPAPSPLAKHE